MADKRLIDIDPLTGVQTWYVNESLSGDEFQIYDVQDVQGVLDHNRAMSNEDHGGWTESRDMRKAASIPLAVIHKWKVEKGVDVFNKDHWEAVRRLVNDPDWRYLRSSHWTV